MLRIVEVLRAANSAYLGPFDTLATGIRSGSIEAEDNLKFLNTAREAFETLASASVEKLPAALPLVLARIRVIGAVSTYFWSDARLTELLRKVGLQWTRI